MSSVESKVIDEFKIKMAGKNRSAYLVTGMYGNDTYRGVNIEEDEYAVLFEIERGVVIPFALRPTLTADIQKGLDSNKTHKDISKVISTTYHLGRDTCDYCGYTTKHLHNVEGFIADEFLRKIVDAPGSVKYLMNYDADFESKQCHRCFLQVYSGLEEYLNSSKGPNFVARII